MSKAPSLWIPGQGIRSTEPKSRLELPRGVMQRFIEFADLAIAHGMGVHCAKCSQDFVGKNGEHDPVLTMTCGCREFWSTQASGRPH